MTAPYSYENNTWSQSYYATMDKPCSYYNLSALTTLDGVPPESELFPLTDDQWEARMDGNQLLDKAVVNGVWGDYVRPIVPIPLVDQATTEMSWISSQASLAAAMGETFTDDMKTYVKSIQAIKNGTDTTSTTLPTRPTDVMS